ncbi:hypothetical protein [Streptomyces chartreusis]|uniref:hypothetical protein n=1 Tax=Streptomyces chartreusis TaxID=1969 RepID=UPI003D747A22
MSQTNTPQRYRIGERDTNDRYPVDVDGAPAGHIYRWHKVWRTVVPGQEETRHPSAESAAEEVTKLVDAGALTDPSASGPAEASQTPDHALLLDLRLQPTAGNIRSAAIAHARIAELAWQPLAGYPGADNHWRMRCLICPPRWEGDRYWSHLRGRNNDRIPRPRYRHEGCIPVPEHAGKLALLVKPAPSCFCPAAHPTTADAAAVLLKSVARARRVRDTEALTGHLTRLLGPCPAATARAAAIEAALEAAKS